MTMRHLYTIERYFGATWQKRWIFCECFCNTVIVQVVYSKICAVYLLYAAEIRSASGLDGTYSGFSGPFFCRSQPSTHALLDFWASKASLRCAAIAQKKRIEDYTRKLLRRLVFIFAIVVPMVIVGGCAAAICWCGFTLDYSSQQHEFCRHEQFAYKVNVCRKWICLEVPCTDFECSYVIVTTFAKVLWTRHWAQWSSAKFVVYGLVSQKKPEKQ